MKTILVTAYAINPYKGSEDGMGWNFTLQIARHHKVIAVTRINNGPHIEKYKEQHPQFSHLYNNIQFLYFDWPYFLRFWKKGSLLSLVYYYGWQLTLALWLAEKKLQVDIVHNLNFHNDWTPSFLWLLGKPLVWGPVGHHDVIPTAYIKPVYGEKEYKKDRFLGKLKKCFWSADPFLKLTTYKAKIVLCMNTQAAEKLKLQQDKFRIIPSVASETVGEITGAKEDFTIISAGRFVPLKGFDLTIRSFSTFYHGLSAAEQSNTKLILAGAGPQLKFLTKIIREEGIEDKVEIIPWMQREQLSALYKRASVFLFPSHEGAGMVVAEAMSYGLSVVCLDNAGPGEFVHPQSTLKVAYSQYNGTIQALAQNLTQLYSDAVFYEREKALALERFHHQFRWEVRGDQLKQVYEEVLQKEILIQKTISFR